MNQTFWKGATFNRIWRLFAFPTLLVNLVCEQPLALALPASTNAGNEKKCKVCKIDEQRSKIRVWTYAACNLLSRNTCAIENGPMPWTVVFKKFMKILKTKIFRILRLFLILSMIVIFALTILSRSILVVLGLTYIR